MRKLTEKIDKMVEELFNDTEIIDQLLNENLDEVYKQIEGEMVMDVIDIKLSTYFDKKEREIYQLKYGLKYALFIVKFERAEQYERCKYIKDAMVMAYKDIYNNSNADTMAFFNLMCIGARETYKGIDDLIKMVNDRDNYGEDK